jgi:hypothetical protein
MRPMYASRVGLLGVSMLVAVAVRSFHRDRQRRGPGEVLPFRFKEQPEQGVPYPSVVVLLSPAEWAAVEKDELTLPAGWEKTRLKKVV